MTAHSLYSAQWFRVAGLTPRLRGHVQVRRQHYRGERWMLLVDPSSGRAHRLDDAAWQLMGRCNGQRTLDQVWRALRDSRGDALPSQDDCIQALVRLHEAGLVHCALNADAQALFTRRQRRERAQRLAASNPFAFSVPLGNPTRLLAALAPLGRALFSPAGALVWLLLVAAALLGAFLEGPRLAAQVQPWWTGSRTLVLVGVAYPLLKAWHELAHGLALQRLGAEVPSAGISLLYFMPVPWVDASAANRMPLARERMLVSAAGVLGELGLAALALLLWLVVQPGTVSDLALAVALTGTVSTLAANANPLLRLDGYYFATDALELPNLALRSGLWWRQALLRHVLRLKGPAAAPFACAQGERGWLMAYAPLSWACRALLAGASALWLGGVSAALGMLVVVVAAWGLLAKPGLAALRVLRAGALGAQDVVPARRRALGVVVLATAALAALPLPFVTTTQGVVWLPEQAWVRLGTDGTVQHFWVADGSPVAAGTSLLQVDNAELSTRHEQVSQQLAAAHSGLYQALGGRDSNATGAAATDAQALAAELATLAGQLAQREVRAGEAGVLALPQQQALLGRWFERGETLGHVLPPHNTTVRVALPQAEAQRITQGLRAIEVRTADQPHRLLHARLLQSTPAVDTRLPSAALGTQGGGGITVDPQDTQGRTAREPVALMDLAVDQPLGALVGGHAWVRFDHGSQPLAAQAWRQVRQLVRGHFNPRG